MNDRIHEILFIHFVHWVGVTRYLRAVSAWLLEVNFDIVYCYQRDNRLTTIL